MFQTMLCSTVCGTHQISRSGGMVDAADSKSVARKGVRVQVPPSALKFDNLIFIC